MRKISNTGRVQKTGRADEKPISAGNGRRTGRMPMF